MSEQKTKGHVELPADKRELKIHIKFEYLDSRQRASLTGALLQDLNRVTRRVLGISLRSLEVNSGWLVLGYQWPTDYPPSVNDFAKGLVTGYLEKHGIRTI